LFLLPVGFLLVSFHSILANIFIKVIIDDDTTDDLKQILTSWVCEQQLHPLLVGGGSSDVHLSILIGSQTAPRLSYCKELQL
jgi:hypothetical protein